MARFERKPAKVQVFFRIEGNSGVCASKACTFAGILINRQACAQKNVFLQEIRQSTGPIPPKMQISFVVLSRIIIPLSDRLEDHDNLLYVLC
ncbi:hypothetical protein [Paenibacillus timonensis]|uniref:hypothetical protein n=1 Tax=Paenibacillus timonensis TaxID=225915 RepID=UPI0022E68DED|nr:hypothetical protein [Paenibacillus timonensis]